MNFFNFSVPAKNIIQYYSVFQLHSDKKKRCFTSERNGMIHQYRIHSNLWISKSLQNTLLFSSVFGVPELHGHSVLGALRKRNDSLKPDTSGFGGHLLWNDTRSSDKSLRFWNSISFRFWNSISFRFWNSERFTKHLTQISPF